MNFSFFKKEKVTLKSPEVKSELSKEQLEQQIALMTKIEETAERVGMKADVLKTAIENRGGVEKIKEYLEADSGALSGMNQGTWDIKTLKLREKFSADNAKGLLFLAISSGAVLPMTAFDESHMLTVLAATFLAGETALGIWQILKSSAMHRKGELTAALMKITDVPNQTEKVSTQAQ
jgi:hypothetical protein